MDLLWDKQISVMTKYIMDWRWKVLISKADPAQIKCSITEWLFPRLEIGLLHKISVKVCNAWRSTIVNTMSLLGGMKTMKSINREAFCILSGIPDPWLRMHHSCYSF